MLRQFQKAQQIKPNKALSTLRALALVPIVYLGSSGLALAEQTNVIVNCNADCAPLVEKVALLGGQVTNKFQHVDGFSATLDSAQLTELYKLNPAAEINKDRMVSIPSPKDQVDLAGHANMQLVQGQMLKELNATAKPKGFEFNNLLTGSAVMNAAGFNGDGVVVAVIDSGTANNAALVPALSGSVIGGENFVPGAGEPSATSTTNGSHGTQTGTMIAGHSYFFFDSASTFAQSLNNNMPSSILYDYLPGLSVVPMFGSAPNASLYAMKVFPAAGGGAPESRIIAAMDRALTMKMNYDGGSSSTPVNAGCGAEDDPCVYDSLNIQVVNMSLGGGTSYAGRDLEDQMTMKMLDAGIVVVTSAGNEGFAAVTGGSPGTGLGSLTVGAASTVGNERVLRDLQYGLGIGELFRPSNHHQMADFSSRGPSADGRISTNVVANGYACLVQGPTGGLNLVNGTSFSSPMVAGAAATLRQAFPDASAVQIRNALIQGANPSVLGDNSSAIDQGHGFIDVPSAYGLLASGTVNTAIEQGKGSKFVVENIKSAGLMVAKPNGKNKLSKHLSGMKAGQVEHIFIESRADTEQLIINLKNIVPSLPAEEQNLFFGDDVYFKVQDAVTHSEVTLASGFAAADQSITIDNPQTGVVRLAIMGDWTNAGEISLDVEVAAVRAPRAAKSAVGKVAQDESQLVEFMVPDGTTQLSVELGWKNNWSTYPTDDIDLILFDPSFAINFDGATLASPERAVVDAPAAGVWTALIQGYTVHGVNLGPDSKWELRIKDQDGKVIKKL